MVCLCGRNEDLRCSFGPGSRARPRVRVEGFTEQMNEWLAAADALVHSTGGLTVLEALMRGCPAISYGWGRGHLRAQQRRRFAASGSREVAGTPAELAACASRARSSTAERRPTSFSDLQSAASFVLAAADAR